MAAERVVLTVLGPQWAEAALIFRILVPTAFIATFNPATAWVYVALGRTDRQIRWVTFTSLVRMVAVFIGAHWGAIGVAAASSAVACSLRLPGIVYCFQGTPLQVRHLIQALRTARTPEEALRAIREWEAPEARD